MPAASVSGNIVLVQDLVQPGPGEAGKPAGLLNTAAAPGHEFLGVFLLNGGLEITPGQYLFTARLFRRI